MADGLADDRVVLLLDEAVVIFVIGPAAGKGDLLIHTVAVELVVDELGAIIGVQAKQWKGELRADVLEGLEDMDLGLIFQRSHLHPGRGDIGEVERLTVLTKTGSPIVRDQVGLAEARACVVPVGECSDRDMMFQEGPGTGGRAGLQACLRPGLGQESVNGCRADREELSAECLLRDRERSLALQKRQHLPDERNQALPAQTVGESPQLPQSSKEAFPFVVSPAAALCSDCPAMAHNKDDPTRSLVEDLEMFLPARAQHKGCITAGVAGQTGDLIQDLAPFALGGFLEAWSLLSDDGVTFTHGEPHG